MSDIINSLNWRYATKAYDHSKKISEKDVDELLEAMRLSPSSFGLQPWKFLLIENKELREKIKEKAWNQPQVTDASHLIVICAKTDVSEEYIKEFIQDTANIRGIPIESLKGYEEMMIGFRKGKTKEEIAEWSKRQAYIPLGILLQSASMKKIDATPMEGFSPQGVDEVLNLKEKGFTSVVLCALGHRSDSDSTSQYKKVRHSVEKIIERK